MRLNVGVTRGRKNPLHLSLPDRLKAERKLRGWTYRDLARASDVSAGLPQNLERRRNVASLDVVERLAKGLGVAPGWLAFGQGAKLPLTADLRSKVQSLAEWVEATPDPRGKELAALLRAAYGLAERESSDEAGE